MRTRICLPICITFVLIISNGCNGPLGSIARHMDRVTNIYEDHLTHPAAGLTTLVTYLESNNAIVRASVDELRKKLSDERSSANRLKLAVDIQQTLGERRERLFQSRIAWQKVAIIDPSTSEQIRNLGSVSVEENQMAFDAAISALFRDVNRLISR